MILYKGMLIYPINFFNSGYVITRPIVPVAITEYGCGVHISYGDIKKRLEPVLAKPTSIMPSMSTGYMSPGQPIPSNENERSEVFTHLWDMTLITSPVTVLSLDSTPNAGVKSKNTFSMVADFGHETGYEVEYCLALGANIIDVVKTLWDTDEIGIVDMVMHFSQYPMTKVYCPLSDYELKIEKELILSLRHDDVRNKILEYYKENLKVF